MFCDGFHVDFSMHAPIASFLSFAWYLLQVHFPVFIGSSVYLRFLDELVQMLNKDDETTSVRGSGDTKPDRNSGKTPVLKVGHTVMGKDLDDPDSLWERPAFL